MTTQSSTLVHFGVLGMKWGVRRYQEYPKGKHGTFLGQTRDNDLRIKKNTSAYRVQSSGELKGEGQSFISLDKLDTLTYLSAAVGGDMGIAVDATMGTRQIYNVKLKLSNDIIMPSYQKSMDAFIKTVDSIGVKKVVKEIGYSDSKTSKEFIKQYKKLEVDSFRDKAYISFVRSFMKDTEAKRTFFKELSDQGYNAIIDENDFHFGDGNYAKAPVIVFDKQKTMKKIDATKLSKEDSDFFYFLSNDGDAAEEYGVAKKYRKTADKWEKYVGKKLWKNYGKT